MIIHLDDDRDPCTDLIVAHALSLVVRGEVGPSATDELLEAAEHDTERLETAFRRCLLCDVLDQGTVRAAARLIQRSIYFSRSKPLEKPLVGSP